METLIAWFLADVLPYLLGLLAVVFGFVFARQSGKSRGRRDAEIEMLRNYFKQQGKADEVQRDIEGLDDDAVRMRASDWVRGKGSSK